MRRGFGLPVMKALPIETRADLSPIRLYAKVADRLLFDARAPREATRPGGLGKTFDWRLLEDLDAGVPFMLSGGLDAGNVAEALRITRRAGGRCLVRRRARAGREGPGQDPRLRARRARWPTARRPQKVASTRMTVRSSPIPSAPGPTSTGISASMAAASSPRR